MDPGLDNKRPRLSTSGGSWQPGTPHGSRSLPAPPATQHPAPGPYHTFPPRSSDPPHPPRSLPPSLPPVSQGSSHHPPPPIQHHLDDRRHHDQDPYAPMHDQYRPHPASPVHPPPFHGGYPVRDPAIKRDPSEDHHPQPRRPLSTGNAQDVHPMTPGAATGPPPPPPQSYPEDPRRHMGYDAGPSAPPTPGSYRHPSYPPPTPVTTQSHYDHAVYPSDSLTYVYPATAKRKATRASQACDSCRSLKAKCDETKPCKNCREKNVECKYRDPIPKAADKAQADILDGINDLRKTVEQFMAHQDNINQMLMAKVDRPGWRIAKGDLKQEEAGLEDDFKAANAPQSPTNVSPNYQFNVSPAYDVADEEIEAEPGEPVVPGEPSIPVNHTTGAGHLLGWLSIKDMVQHLLVREGIIFPKEYPIRQEEVRGLLRVYGRGEGRDTGSPDRDAQAEHGVMDAGDDASYSDMSSPSPGESWGHFGGFSPINTVEYSSNPKTSALSATGSPDFSESKVWQYVQSFEDNILNMHPIIPLKELHGMVTTFLDSIAKSGAGPSNPVTIAKFVQSPQPTLEVTGSKRKRSPAIEPQETPVVNKPGRPARTVNNAVVLAILALGKICLHRDYIPDVVPDAEAPKHGSPITKNGHPASPAQGSPPDLYSAPSHSSGQPSPREHERMSPSRRSSFQGSSSTGKSSPPRRNVDSIPGLEYFALATDVIGNQMGGSSIKHVYANIFAGLYHGQLGRVIESHAYIANACTTLQNIMRPTLDRLRRIKESGKLSTIDRDNKLLFAFWTCLQLESDIVAELPRHQSGILALEENMPYPNTSLFLSDNLNNSMDDLFASYMAQLYLRKHLNNIHRMFYNPNAQGEFDPSKDFEAVSNAQKHVASMAWVPRSFIFSEDDPPADNILAARLRAKYWGAQVITYRPFIKQVLEFSYQLQHNQLSPRPPASEFRECVSAPTIHPDTRVFSDIDPQVMEYVRKGIRALVESTQAFHGLGDKRPIITNVFGTAHAQWGNLLVLAACYRDPFLRAEINEVKLKHLFGRTISFFRKIVGATSALAHDMRILEGIQRDLFESIDPHANTSFSSNTSTGPPPTRILQHPSTESGMPPHSMAV